MPTAGHDGRLKQHLKWIMVSQQFSSNFYQVLLCNDIRFASKMIYIMVLARKEEGWQVKTGMCGQDMQISTNKPAKCPKIYFLPRRIWIERDSLMGPVVHGQPPVMGHKLRLLHFYGSRTTKVGNHWAEKVILSNKERGLLEVLCDYSITYYSHVLLKKRS